ncbi:uncharacterized protein BDR25DRAFT_279302 [Lindgomyces ingoldianus]|uniref:Uncharacterized protein n=1 Tax=Lindgomyces ingoldianus TaxID=673940 RepID=A0ACB6R882_9PLEO|nr:uncharacterized protein BDR25DRAFT_279302 [Lindgomyces ingoldianus]KAF2475292.1 hypothetical protein BDR25DRAFT_279302 [Lindgomyces ingoldianus]
MATKMGKLSAFGGMHTAGIYSDMTVDGPEIGTLVVVVDRAKNLPNRRTMGKQDPYCAARLGKEAKKTETDKRGGQTPKWDQELRFTVHDSPDYHQLKVSVFNDDKKTELIGETWVSLETILTPGGGQSDTWHGLNCKGKYAGEIRIELTYYDTRPKAEKTPVEKKETARTEVQRPSVGGPRESTPVKRRPLPSDPTGTSPSPAGTPDHRGLQATQSGPRNYPTPPRQQRSNEYSTPTHQRRSQLPEGQPQSVERRRPLPEASPLNNNTPSSSHHTPQHRASRVPEHDPYSPAQNPPPSHSNTPQYNEDGFDMSYTAPKPYEVQPIDPSPQHTVDGGNRATQNDLRSSHGHSPSHMELAHSYSTPVVPTQHGYESESPYQDPYAAQSQGYSNGHAQQGPEEHRQLSTTYQEPPYHVEPLRPQHNATRSNDFGHNQVALRNSYHGTGGYMDQRASYSPANGRPSSAMQPTVEDEDDCPPPPPMHRSNAATIVHHPQQSPPSYPDDAPAPLNINRYREQPAAYDSPPQSYGTNEYANPHPAERRYTNPRMSMSPQPNSRPVSRDTMAPSPLRQETALIPSSLVAGYDPYRQDTQMTPRSDNRDSDAYQEAPSYETPSRQQRHLSEPDYRTPPQYDTPSRPHLLTQHNSFPLAESPSYYQHSSPQEPHHVSPYQDSAPMIKPRAMSPAEARTPADKRMSRTPNRSMPTRKSVSPRPPPSTADPGDRRLSGVPFNPDSFDVLNPSVSQNSNSRGNGGSEDDRRGSNAEVNEKGQVVTFHGRVIDASDHLPIDSWAPEPERKGPQKDRPVRERAALNGTRDIEAAKERERQRKERERIRNAVNSSVTSGGSPSTALVTSRHRYSSSQPMNDGAMVLSDHSATSPSTGRNRLQKRNQRPVSTYTSPSHQSPAGNIPSPNSLVLRERENVGGYGGSPGYGAGSRHSVAAPPIPAKIPLDSNGNTMSEDMTALSLELQSIDIGGSAGRNRGAARRRYGGGY